MEQIKIGSFPPGKAYGAFIYNVSVSVGTQGQPSSIDVDLINESGEYNITEDDLEASSPVSIKIQSSSGDFVSFKSCFLVSYSEDRTLDSSTLKLKYVDGSSVLDKIQVLLLNKQASPANFNIVGLNEMEATPVGGFDPTWYKTYINPFVSNYTIPVSCINHCPTTGAPAWSTITRINPFNGQVFYPENPKNPWGRRNALGFPVDPRDFIVGTHNYALRNGQVFGASRAGLNPIVNHGHDKCALTNINPNNIHRGGAIVIGEEEFVSSMCQIPNVTYGFEDLKLLLENYVGIKILNWNNRNRPDLKESFTGSLRDVLNAWGKLYGFQFTWDFGNDNIIAIDLQNTNTGNDILLIKDLIENLAQDTSDPSAALKINYSTSIEGTYRQDDISTFQRPAKKKTIDDKFTRRVLFEPVTLENIIPYKEAGTAGTTPQEVQQWYKLTGGRSSAELIISSVLAKFNKNARTLYNYWLIASKTNGFDETLMKQYGGMGRPLGLSIRKILSAQEQNDILNYTFCNAERLINENLYGIDSGIFLGTYSKELEDKWIRWEMGIADFLGKYYIHSNFINDLELRSEPMQQCFDRDVETIPQSDIYINGSNLSYFQNDERYKSMTNDLPFKDLLRHPGGATFNLVHPDTKAPLNQFRLISRNPNYGFNEEAVEKLFFEDAEDLLKEFIPSFVALDGNHAIFLQDLIEESFPDLWDKLLNIKVENKKPMLFFFPTADKVRQTLDIPLGLRGIAGYDFFRQTGNAFPTQMQIATETNTNIAQVWNSREYSPPKQKDEEITPCKLMCDVDITSFLCDCPDGESIYGYSPSKVGPTSLGARFFDLSIPHATRQGRFVLPTEYPYSAFFRVTDKLQKTETGIKQNYGFLNNAANTMGYKVNVRDITSDMETIDSEQARNDGNAGQYKTGGNVEQGQEGEGQIKAHVLINKYDESTRTTGKIMEAREFHGMTDSSYTNDLANKQLSFEIVGYDFDALKINGTSIISSAFGLSSLSITYGEGGLIMSFSYETRHPETPDFEGVLQRMGPKLNYNSYMRTY